MSYFWTNPFGVCVSIYLSVRVFVCMSVQPSVCLSILCLSACLSVGPYVCLSGVFLTVSLFVCLFVNPSVCQCVCLSYFLTKGLSALTVISTKTSTANVPFIVTLLNTVLPLFLVLSVF